MLKHWILSSLLIILLSCSNSASRNVKIQETQTFSYSNTAIKTVGQSQASSINDQNDNYTSINPEKIETVVQMGHSKSIFQVVYSPDSKLIASGSDDHTIKIWNANTGRLIRTVKKHIDSVNHLAFTPNGAYLTSIANRALIFLDPLTGKELKSIPNVGGPYAFSPDGKKIVGDGYNIKIWDVETGKILMNLKEHKNEIIMSTAYSPDGKYIASVLMNRKLKLWETATGNLLKQWSPHDHWINAVIFTKDSKSIITGSKDRTIKIWETETGKLLKTISGIKGEVRSLKASPNGKLLAAGIGSMDFKANNSASVWDLASGKLLKTFTNHVWAVHTIDFSPDSKRLVSGSGTYNIAFDNLIQIHDIDSGESLFTLKSFSAPINQSVFSPDGKLIASAMKNNTIQIWDRGTTSPLRILQGPFESIDSLAFSPDGKILCAGSKFLTVYLWDTSTWKIIKTLKGIITKQKNMQILHYVHSLSFSPDGKYLATPGEYQSLLVWDVATGEKIKTFSVPMKRQDAFSPHTVLFSNNGKMLAVATDASLDGWVTLFDFDSGRILQQIKLSSPRALAFSPNDQHLAVGDAVKTITIFDTQTGRGIKTLRIEMGLKSVFSSGNLVAYSPDGKYFASGSEDDLIRIWDAKDYHHIRTFRGHTSPITSLAFAREGAFLLSASWDTTARIWNLPNGESISMVRFETGDYFNFTHDAYFDSTRDGGNYISILKGTESYAPDQFALLKNRPDIILKRIGLAPQDMIEHFYAQYQKRLKKSKLSEKQLSLETHVPEAKIISSVQNNKTVELRFSLADSKFSLSHYNIYVNDVPIFGAFGKKLSEQKAELTEIIELTAGKNKIEVSCVNENGIESYRALTFADYKGKEKGSLYFIGFGVSKYKDSKLNLKYAHKDAQNLAELVGKTKNRYDQVHIKTYLNEQVTRESIEQAKTLLTGAKPDDTFILFIAGHGLHDQDREATYYYLTHNTDLNNLSGTAANFDLIEDLLQGIAPRNKLFLMDTCESGEVEEQAQNKFFSLAGSRGIKARTARGLSVAVKTQQKTSHKRPFLLERDRYIYNDLTRRSGAIVFSSSKGGEFSYESDSLQNGFFTHEILNALKGKTVKTGFISVEELKKYVIQAVAKLSAGLQNPTVDRDNLYQKITLPVIK